MCRKIIFDIKRSMKKFYLKNFIPDSIRAKLQIHAGKMLNEEHSRLCRKIAMEKEYIQLSGGTLNESIIFPDDHAMDQEHGSCEGQIVIKISIPAYLDATIMILMWEI